MSRASLARELQLIVPGTAVLAVDDLVRRHGLSSAETLLVVKATGHSYVERAALPHGGEDDPTIELEREEIKQALSRVDPAWRDEDSGTWKRN
jgi:hypothetical protein